MAYAVSIGDQVNINLSSGSDEDYTFTSSSPTLGTIDAEGVFTALGSGLVAVTVVRNSDGATVGSVLFRVLSASVEGLPTLSLTPVVPPAPLIISADFPGALFVSWHNIDLVTDDPESLALYDETNDHSYTVLAFEPSGMCVILTDGSTGESLGTIDDEEVELSIRTQTGATWNAIQYSTAVTLSTTPAISSITRVNGTGSTVDVGWTSSTAVEQTYTVQLRHEDGEYQTDEFFVVQSGTSHTVNLNLTGAPTGIYDTRIYLGTFDPEVEGFQARTYFERGSFNFNG